jgi:GNAT superfamily N-acetyltransferase
MMHSTIRKLTVEDTEELLGFYRRLDPATTAVFRPFPHPDVATIQTHLEESGAGAHFSMGLFDSSTLVGHGFIIRLADANPVLGLGIAGEYRGRGYGRLLAVRLLTEYDRIGSGAVTLTVVKHNLIAIGLYESLGFVRRGDHTFTSANDSQVMVRPRRRQ